jgi:hypothetical protein
MFCDTELAVLVEASVNSGTQTVLGSIVRDSPRCLRFSLRRAGHSGEPHVHIVTQLLRLGY